MGISLEEYVLEENTDDLFELNLQLESLSDTVTMELHRIHELTNAFTSTVINGKAPSMESIEGILTEGLGFEDIVSDNEGSRLGRLWDDFFTTRHRVIQGIVDTLRSNKKTIKAYRNKIAAKQKKLIKSSGADSDQHSASFVSMEKYWLNVAGEYPRSVVGAVEVDFDKSSNLIKNAPKVAVDEIKRISDFVYKNSNKGADLTNLLEKEAKNWKTLEEIIGPGIYNKPDLFLYRTAITGPTKVSKTLDDLGSKNNIMVISGGWGPDIINALTLVAPTFISIIGVGLQIYRNQVATPGFTLTGRELRKLSDYAIKYLDSAEAGYNDLINHLTTVNVILSNTNSKLAENDDVDHSTVAKVLNVINNDSQLVGKDMMKMVDRQIKVAKGINYLLMRTINRKKKT